MQVNHLHHLINSMCTPHRSQLLQEMNWGKIHTSLLAPNTQIGHGLMQESGNYIHLPHVPRMSLFHGSGEQSEGLQTWAERNAARCLEKKQRRALFCSVFWVWTSRSSEGTRHKPGDSTHNRNTSNNNPQGEKFGSTAVQLRLVIT